MSRIYGNRCKKQNHVKNVYNKRAADFIQNGDLSYFGKKCPDPYTALAYWRRRFRGQQCYLNQYFIPYTTNYNKWSVGNGNAGYKANGFSLGWTVPVLYLTKHQFRKGGRWNNKTWAPIDKCAAGRYTGGAGPVNH